VDSRTDKLCQLLLDQIAQLWTSLEAAEARALQYQQLAQRTATTATTAAAATHNDHYSNNNAQNQDSSQKDTMTIDRHAYHTLLAQNKALTEQLTAATLHTQQHSAQQLEVTSLWMVLQELSKLGADSLDGSEPAGENIHWFVCVSMCNISVHSLLVI
jgi:hypothetical protein